MRETTIRSFRIGPAVVRYSAVGFDSYSDPTMEIGTVVSSKRVHWIVKNNILGIEKIGLPLLGSIRLLPTISPYSISNKSCYEDDNVYNEAVTKKYAVSLKKNLTLSLSSLS